MAQYRAQELVGRGGMAEVWRGEMTTEGGAGRPVALKFLLPHLADDAALLSLLRAEAELSMRLSHGNVVQVFDFGQLDGRWFLAMEWVDGTSLWQVLKAAKAQGVGAVHPAMAAQLLVAVLDGLHHAHTRVEPDGKPLQLVHRDVAPDNVLVAWDGQVKVADFGIARAAMAGRKETQPGIFKGKLAFAAPEQARSEAVDARADVYAAGVMLWELVTGENPAAARALDIAAGRARIPPFPPDTVDGTFAAVVDRAVAAAPSGRFPSAKAFRDALTAWLSTQPPKRAGPAELMAWLFPDKVSSPRLKMAGAGTGQWLLSWARPGPTDAVTQPAQHASRAPWVVLGLLLAAGLGLASLTWQRARLPIESPAVVKRQEPAPPIAPVAPAAVAPPIAPSAPAAAPQRAPISMRGKAQLRLTLDSRQHEFPISDGAGLSHDNLGSYEQRVNAPAGMLAVVSDRWNRVTSVHTEGRPFTLGPSQQLHLLRFEALANAQADVDGRALVPKQSEVPRQLRLDVDALPQGPVEVSVNALPNRAAPLGVVAFANVGAFLGPGKTTQRLAFIQPGRPALFEGESLWFSLPRSDALARECGLQLQRQPPGASPRPLLQSDAQSLAPQLADEALALAKAGRLQAARAKLDACRKAAPQYPPCLLQQGEVTQQLATQAHSARLAANAEAFYAAFLRLACPAHPACAAVQAAHAAAPARATGGR